MDTSVSFYSQQIIDTLYNKDYKELSITQIIEFAFSSVTNWLRVNNDKLNFHYINARLSSELAEYLFTDKDDNIITVQKAGDIFWFAIASFIINNSDKLSYRAPNYAASSSDPNPFIKLLSSSNKKLIRSQFEKLPLLFESVSFQLDCAVFLLYYHFDHLPHLLQIWVNIDPIDMPGNFYELFMRGDYEK